MLMLTRKSGEEILIGNEITVQVIQIKGKQVRLGITAPKSYSIDRKEVYERKGLEKQNGRP